MTFGVESTMGLPMSFILDTIVLTATNAVMDQITNLALAAFPEIRVFYLPVDEHIVDSGSPSITPVEYRNKLKPSELPPHELKLKVDQLIICLRNINLQGKIYST